ncbi:hypothetical protein ACOKW7_18315 [Limnospira platensis CENA597]|uniref:hypothetical protein n=1 Tax=Oscillatoriales TaxID=1150 RepID=UPI00396F53F0
MEHTSQLYTPAFSPRRFWWCVAIPSWSVSPVTGRMRHTRRFWGTIRQPSKPAH